MGRQSESDMMLDDETRKLAAAMNREDLNYGSQIIRNEESRNPND